MKSASRRDFLRKAFASAPAWALTNGIHLGGPLLRADDVRPQRTPANLARFIDPLPIPKRLSPYSTRNGVSKFRVRMLEFTRQMHSQLPPARLWGYEGQYPGPIIEAFRGESFEVTWENQLPLKHLFEVDPRIHGAMPPSPAVRTVPHLHGSRTTSESDGLPEKWFTPGNSARYSYPNHQAAATLWYHDHAVGITRLNVYAGLSGFYLLRDEEERAMNLPAGDYEIPLLIQDRTLDAAGQLVYSPTHEDEQPLPPGVWGPEFFGKLPVINGAVYPYLEVEPRLYRLRILNGSNSRFFNFYFNLAKRAIDIPALISFQQIGTDGGFLPKPAALTHLLLGPAERADLLVDFSALAGKTITLSNNAHAPFPGWGMIGMHSEPLLELMQFRVARPLAAPGKSISMAPRPAFTHMQESAAVASRDFVLSERVDSQGRSLGVRINEKGYDDAVTEIVKLGTVEKWRFINTTDDAHPMHLHLVQFQVLHRQGFDPFEFRKGVMKTVGDPRPPAANEAGLKDTAVVSPNEILTLLIKFEGYTGRYVFHCHMLEHEDNDMMRPYEVTA